MAGWLLVGAGAVIVGSGGTVGTGVGVSDMGEVGIHVGVAVGSMGALVGNAGVAVGIVGDASHCTALASRSTNTIRALCFMDHLLKGYIVVSQDIESKLIRWAARMAVAIWSMSAVHLSK